MARWIIIALLFFPNIALGGVYVSGGVDPVEIGRRIAVSSPGVITLASGSVTRANTKISAVDGTAFVDFSTTNVLTDYVTYRAKLTITDSAGKKLVGYIKAAGTGETYNDVLAGWDFTSGWINYSKATINDADTFTTTSAGGVIKNDVFTELACYRANFTANVSSGSDAKLIGYSVSLGTGSGSGLSETQPVVNFYYTTAPSFTSCLLRNNAAATTDVTSLKVEQVLTPSATGVTITSTPDGSTYNWESQESGFNYNDASGYTYAITTR